MVLANVPSFRFSFRGNIRRNHPFGNHPFVNTKGHWEIKGRFRKRVVLANVPSFRGNIRRNHPFGNLPFANPRKGGWKLFLKRALQSRPSIKHVVIHDTYHGSESHDVRSESTTESKSTFYGDVASLGSSS